MARYPLIAVLAATFLVFAALYAPQPLLPLLAASFDISESRAALLITWSLIPMSIAPLVLGALMQVIEPRRILAGCLLLLGVVELLFYVIDHFLWMEILRVFVGTLVSTAVAAIMTYIAGTAQNLKHVMSLYVGVSVFGGLGGRLMAGYIAQLFDWRLSFLVFGIALLACGLATLYIPNTRYRQNRWVDYRRLADVIKMPFFSIRFGIVGLAFFVVMAILNFIPFRLADLNQASGNIALSYTGFLIGATVSFAATRITDWLGTELRTVAVGLVILAGAVCLLWIPSGIGVFLSISAATSGFFLLHAVMSAYVNAQAGADASSVNSLYVALYYIGGSLGSYVPGLFYGRGGWPAYLGVLFLMVGSSMVLTLYSIRRAG